MIETLIDELNNRLENCRYYANKGDFPSARTFYDHAFGMLLMFGRMCPELSEQANDLWMKEYYPKFAGILFE